VAAATVAAEKQKQWFLNGFNNGNISSTAVTSDGPVVMAVSRENSGSAAASNAMVAMAVEQDRVKQSTQGDALGVMRVTSSTMSLTDMPPPSPPSPPPGGSGIGRGLFNSIIGNNTSGGAMSPAALAAANATAANAQARMTTADSDIISDVSRHATPRLSTSVGFRAPTLFTGSVYHGGGDGSGSSCGVPGGLVGCLSPRDVGTSSSLELELAEGQELSIGV
jgi:hypothetical protein